MTQEERRAALIRQLLGERERYAGLCVPNDEASQRRLLRSLMNVREPAPIGAEFLAVQDDYLREETEKKGVTPLASLSPAEDGLYLWQGDITALACDAIVNAANSGLTGCYVPCHGCVDNCIHTYAGVQMRLACARLIAAQGHEEAAGGAKITPAYNLPCRYVLHTVGPIVRGRVTPEDRRLLASCYDACLALAEENELRSVAFCCISTGEFHFPNETAAQIAVDAVRAHRERTKSGIEVIFCAYKDIDRQIYRGLLGADRKAEAGA